MPVYDYKCRKCGAVFEKFLRSLSAADSVKCEKCGSVEVQKMITCCSISGGGKSEGSDSSSSSSSCGSCSSHSCSTCH
ncbi:MAG: zinc ribbon domain-containing protein [Candidatus Aminicenantes bacterium]|nr:zinc ribbon domain-containing protein [Candidatus Aminicenantes bacterium]